MKQIIDNPYRIVGLLVGSTAREQERQVWRLNQLIDAEQEPQDDFSFPSLGHLHRTLESVGDAASKLNLDSDKMNAALFWFWKGYPITDEVAFDALKDGDIEAAYKLWDDLITRTDEDGKRFWKPLTERNYSAFHNCSVLSIFKSNGNLQNGIVAKLYFLESDLVHKFISSVTDETFKTTKKELQLLFLNQLQSEIENSGIITSNQLLDILNKQEFTAKEDFLKGFVQKPIEQIEKNVEEAKAKRKVNKANAVNIGIALFKDTSENLKLINSILGTSNLKYSTISDKVSDEILQCGIDYFSFYRDSSTDPGSTSMDLFRKAKTLAVGNIAKQRCQENTENLQEWIDEKPQRDKQARVLVDFENLKNLIDEYERKGETVANGKQLLASAKPFLSNVKSILGTTDQLYLGFSTKIASNAQGMCISEINNLQNKLNVGFDNRSKLLSIILLKQKVNEAWDVIASIGMMDLRGDFRINYNNNKASLQSLITQLAPINAEPSQTYTPRPQPSKSSGGCYIATMAYGDYDHPQVMILRKFRDDTLDKSNFGKWFIKTYYHYSPMLVVKLKNKKCINTIIRKTLNQFIKLIKK